MDAGTLRKIYDKARRDGMSMPRLVNEMDTRTFKSVQAFHDSYGNGYAVLSEFEDIDAFTDDVSDGNGSFPVTVPVNMPHPYDWKSPLSSLDDDAPVYVQECEGMRLMGTCLTDDDGITDAIYSQRAGDTDAKLPEVVFFSTYLPRTDEVSKSEKRALVVLNVLQNALFVLVGLLLVLVSGIASSIQEAVSALTLDIPFMPPAVEYILFTICATGVMLGMAALQGKAGDKVKRDVNDRQQRQSLIGEIFQLPAGVQAVYFALTGIGEEVLFRYGICGAMMGLSCSIFGLDAFSSFALACFVSSAIFAVAHSNTYDAPVLLVVFMYGIILACSWVLSGSIIVAIVVHGLYDFTAAMIGRHRMKKNPKVFFFGKRPNAMMSNKLGTKCAENSYEIVF